MIGKVSLDRITRFLRETELLDKWAPQRDVVQPSTSEISIKDAHFTWSNELSTDIDRAFTLTVSGTLTFKPGGLNVIHGPTACGKTSLLMALLGEMHCMPGSDDTHVRLPREAGIAYSAQEPWILSDTVQNNVTFGEPFDRIKFARVIRAVAFDEDLKELPDAEHTIVGERGVTLRCVGPGGFNH